MSVYDTEDFAGRVKLAAAYISARREATRTFDTCFEMSDGDAVAVALYRRTLKNPGTKLAANIWRYLGQESVTRAAEKLSDVRTQDLPNVAAQMRANARRQFAQMMAERGNPEFLMELTEAGEQSVIPGCERNASQKTVQLDLFG